MKFLFKISILFLFNSIVLFPFSQGNKKYFFNRGNAAKLTAKVIENETSEKGKLIAIHDWITNNIKWKDLKPIESNHKTVKKALRRRKGPAKSFIALFEEMCQLAQIETAIVHGNVSSKFSYYYEPRALEISKHTWIAVKLNGEWNLIDVMFDAGHFKKKKYLVRAFIEKNIVIPIPGNPKHFYFIRKKSKWIKNPTKNYFFQRKTMLSTHYPLLPMWQLTEDTISSTIYRKKPWEIREHLDTSSNYEFDFNAKIDKFIFAVHPEYLEGVNGNEHNDTNFVALAHGESRYVDKSVDLYIQKPVYSENELIERLAEIDSLFLTLKLSKQHSKKALQIEKKITSSNNKVHKARNKEVVGQNSKKIAQFYKTKEKTIQLTQQLKQENKRIDEKEVAYDKKVDKYGKWSPSFKDVKPVSTKEYKKRKKLVDELLLSIPKIKKKMDSLETEFNTQLKHNFDELKKQIIDTLNQETSWASKCKLIVELYDHNFDSIYFSSRTIVNRLNQSHMTASDSLMKKFIRLQKKTLSLYKKELSKINSVKKEAYTHLKAIYSNGGTNSQIEKLSSINDMYIKRFSTLRSFKLRIIERNNQFMSWFKMYRYLLKKVISEYSAEMGKEKLRLKADLKYERIEYQKHADRIQLIQKKGKLAKIKLKSEQKKNKTTLKELGSRN